jgi:hypothetical protein
MRIKAVERINKTVQVEINPCDVLDQLSQEIKNKYGVGSDWYINDKGQWEDWYDTGHGSGLTTKHRDASVFEVEIFSALKLIRIAAKGLLS